MEYSDNANDNNNYQDYYDIMNCRLPLSSLEEHLVAPMF